MAAFERRGVADAVEFPAFEQQAGDQTPQQLAAFKAAGYSDRHALEIILAIAVKTLSHDTNHVFHTEADAAFHDDAWQPQA